MPHLPASHQAPLNMHIRRSPLWLATVLVLLCAFAAQARSPAAVAADGINARRWPVRVLSFTLTNQDAADVYAPWVGHRRRDRHADRFPLLAVLQGANVDKQQYSTLGTELARHGFVVVVPNHFRRFDGIPFPVLFSEVEVVTAVYDSLLAADMDPDSPLFGIIDTTRMGVVGHSLGGRVGLEALAGVCSINLCSAYDVTNDADADGFDDDGFEPPAALQTGAFYGTNLVNFVGGLDDLDVAAAALVQGSLDGIATPAEAAASYPLLEPPSALITVNGANHYGVCDDNNPPDALPDFSQPTLEQRVGNLAIARWTSFWLQAQLLDDPRAQRWLYTIGGAFSGIVDVQTD